MVRRPLAAGSGMTSPCRGAPSPTSVAPQRRVQSRRYAASKHGSRDLAAVFVSQPLESLAIARNHRWQRVLVRHSFRGGMQMAKSTKSTSKRRISGARRAATTRSSRAKRPTRGAKRTTGTKKSTGRSSQAKSRTTRTTGARTTGRTSKARSARRSQAETSQKELDDLFFEGLKDVYTAEKQILRALPKMA